MLVMTSGQDWELCFYFFVLEINDLTTKMRWASGFWM